jgi:hypothetical protein
MFVNESSVQGPYIYAEHVSIHNLKRIHKSCSSKNVSYYTVTCLCHNPVPGFLPRRLEFSSWLVPVGLGVDKVTVGPVFLPVLRFSPVGYVSTNDNLIEETWPH